MTRHHWSPGRTAALAAVAVLLGACTSEADGGESSGDDPPPAASRSGDLVRATRLADLHPGTALTPGRYALGFSSDRADAPVVLVDVPAGYVGGGEGYEVIAEDATGSGFRHVGTWTVAEVAARPCGGPDWVDPGASVDDLADSLAALPVWESTRPAAISVGGHEGVSMELDVPADIPARCGGEPLSWKDHLGGTQGIGPGKTQRLWIVDVDGHRLMLVAGYFPGPEGPTGRQVDEMTQMVEGATFVDSDQVAP